MTKIIFIEHSGKTHEIDADDGVSAMRTANDNGVPGIIADCGGCMTCATCHVYVDPDWTDRVGAPSADEEAMLEGAIDPQPNSRLSCQIIVEPALDGVVLRIPKNQF